MRGCGVEADELAKVAAMVFALEAATDDILVTTADTAVVVDGCEAVAAGVDGGREVELLLLSLLPGLEFESPSKSGSYVDNPEATASMVD